MESEVLYRMDEIDLWSWECCLIEESISDRCYRDAVLEERLKDRIVVEVVFIALGESSSMHVDSEWCVGVSGWSAKVVKQISHAFIAIDDVLCCHGDVVGGECISVGDGELGYDREFFLCRIVDLHDIVEVELTHLQR